MSFPRTALPFVMVLLLALMVVACGGRDSSRARDAAFPRLQRASESATHDALVEIAFPGSPDIDDISARYERHTDALGVTYGDQSRMAALGGTALVVEGHGRAGSTGYMLDRIFVQDGPDRWFGAIVTMADSDVPAYRDEAYALLRDQLRVRTSD